VDLWSDIFLPIAGQPTTSIRLFDHRNLQQVVLICNNHGIPPYVSPYDWVSIYCHHN